MTRPLAASSTFWRRLIVDALTAVAALALAFAAVSGTPDVLHQALFAALLLAVGVMVEPQHAVLRRSDRRARPGARSVPMPV